MVSRDISVLKCGLVNIQSVTNKIQEIRDLINENRYDVLMLTETWLSECDRAKINEMTPATHAFFHCPRENRRGGGVGIMLSTSFSKVKVHQVERFDTFEHIQVSCEMGNGRYTFIIIYRPPDTNINNFIDELRSYLETTDMVSTNNFICGDFNLWMDDINARGVTDFSDLLDYFSLRNLVDAATSVSGHILDLVITDSDSSLVLDLTVDDICNISPVHKLITFTVPFVGIKKQTETITFRLKNSFMPEALLEKIVGVIQQRMIDTCEHNLLVRNCVSCIFALYNSIVRSEYDEMCPMVEKNIVVVDQSPWYNYEVDRAKKEKKRCERFWRRCKTEDSRRIYQIARNNEQKIIRKRKCDYYRKKTSDARNDINKLYRILHSLTGYKKKNKLPEGYTDDVLSTKFLEFFDNKIRNIIESFRPDYTNRDLLLPEPTVQLQSFCTVNTDCVEKIIKKVKYTYCDMDPIPVRDIVSCESFGALVGLWTELVNTSIENKVFPKSEKSAIVKPIVKGNLDSQCFSSFRPVSNLTFMSKIIENVILEQLLEHMQLVGALPDEQSAYRKLYSTETAMCSVVNDLLITLDDGKRAILIMLDLSAAFDTVVHDLLLRDCMNIGIVGDALEYLESYLEGRTYCVQIGQSFSASKNLDRGVPQGSVLGPLLFCIYTIELSYLIKRHGVNFKLFADDTQLYMSFENVRDTELVITSIMSDISNWMESKQLKLNENKTECLILARPHEIKRLNIFRMTWGNVEVEVQNSVKDLGVMIDSALSFRGQINQTVKTAGYHLKNIAFIRKYLDMETTKMLVHNYVISRLDYCNILYYGLPKYLLRKLQLVMNRAARLIKGVSPRERITPILMELHWLPIRARVVFKMLCITYLALKFERPLYIYNMLRAFYIDSDMVLRHESEVHRLIEPRFNTELGRRAFEKSAPRLYNKLPETVKTADSLELFKKRLKTYLFTESYNQMTSTINENYNC